ncbi:MAG: hypothetical protein FD180_3819 [Planctomycetota bacterium]|nr:MAG: hypothetical protein FD180_3819 [Planctomycetota bacterium]
MPTAYLDKKLETRAGKLERKIFKLKQQLSALHRSGKPRAIPDYVFRTHNGKPLRLSQAFGKHQDLVLVHNMGTFCPYCTLWADGLVSLLPHLQDRAGFLVVSNDSPAKQKAFAKSRGWTFPMASCAGTTFFADMGFADKDGNFWPGFTTFRRNGKRVERVGRRFFGPGDDFCSAWHFFDLLPKGANGWQPKFKY